MSARRVAKRSWLEDHAGLMICGALLAFTLAVHRARARAEEAARG